VIVPFQAIGTIRGFWQMPGRHSLAQRGAQPERPGCERLSHRVANTSFRPRNKLANNATRPSAVPAR
jgi:hypothetical protein